jgi:hypothetical protein
LALRLLANKDLGELSPEARQQLSALLPQEQTGQPTATNSIASRNPYRAVYESDLGSLKIRETSLGRQVELIVKVGQTMREVYDALNAKCKKEYGHDAIYRGKLYKDQGLHDKLTGDLFLEFIPVLKDSNNKVKLIKHGEDSQEALLKLYNMDFVERLGQVAAGAMYRVATGKDLFEGKLVRSRLGAVASPHGGALGGYDYYDGDRHVYVFASGGVASPSN